jgi:hypothetical protein
MVAILERPLNHRAALDAGICVCYESGVTGPARVSAGRSAALHIT